MGVEGKSMNWDLFLSHASEDKEDVARPLHKLEVGKRSAGLVR